MRSYLSIVETSKIIAGEVVQYGTSQNWASVNSANIDTAKELEKHLAKFNIGYTDPKHGTWSVKKNGTRYFSAMTMVTSAKDRLNTVISYFKK